MKKGILKLKDKISTFMLCMPWALIIGGFGLSLGMIFVGGEKYSNTIEKFKETPIFKQEQLNDIQSLKQMYENLEISEDKYYEKLDYYKENYGYASEVLERNIEGTEEYQQMLKTANNYSKASFAGLGSIVLGGIITIPIGKYFVPNENEEDTPKKKKKHIKDEEEHLMETDEYLSQFQSQE